MKKTKILSISLLVICTMMSGSMSSCKWFKHAGDKKMTITAGFSMPGILRSLSSNPSDTILITALRLAQLMQAEDSADFMIFFAKAWNKTAPNVKLASVFSFRGKAQMSSNSSNQEIIQQLNKEVDGIIDRSIFVTKTRLENLNCKIINVQKAKNRSRFTIDLDYVADQNQVLKLIQYNGNLQFWETFDYKEVYPFIDEADKKMKALIAMSDTNASEEKKKDEGQGLNENKRDNGKQTYEEYAADHPLHAKLQPALVQDEQGNYYPERGPVVGYCQIVDTARVNRMLHFQQIKRVFPHELHFAWSVKPSEKDKTSLALIALKSNRDGKPALDAAGVITDANQDYTTDKHIEIGIKMNSEGAAIWRSLTANNIGKSIAIVLDGYVYSYPTVQNEIPNGNSSITGNFTESEAKDLASILKAGKLPAQIVVLDVLTRDKDGNIIK
jgi:SecD/SecF fusion protein